MVRARAIIRLSQEGLRAGNPHRNPAAGNEGLIECSISKEEFEWGGRKLTLETGKIARQADGAVLATYGETVVLATVVGATPRVKAWISSRSP